MTRWLDIAWAEQGTAEVAGAAANPEVIQPGRLWARASMPHCSKRGQRA